jgi:hypothetical protein
VRDVPNGRFLSRSIAANEELASVSLEADYLFTRCLPHLDAEGRMTGNPALVKSIAVPLRAEITAESIPGLLLELASAVDHEGMPLVRWYDVSGRQCLAFPGFAGHNKGLKKDREASSKVPTPDDRNAIPITAPPSPDPVRPTSRLSPDHIRTNSGVHPATVRSESPVSLSSRGSSSLSGSGRESAPAPQTAPLPLAIVPASATASAAALDDPAPPFEKAHRPTVTLPASAKRFVDEVYGLATEQRRADVTRQLYDAIDPAKRGARLRGGVYVKTTPDRLGNICEAVRLNLPQTPDAAIVFVLRKLQDAETDAQGRTVTEAASAHHREAVALEDRYSAAMVRAGSAWAAEHAADTEAIGRKLRADFGDVSDLPDDHWKRIAHDSALATELRKASGFPDFDAWVATRQTRDASATAARSA